MPSFIFLSNLDIHIDMQQCTSCSLGDWKLGCYKCEQWFPPPPPYWRFVHFKMYIFHHVVAVLKLYHGLLIQKNTFVAQKCPKMHNERPRLSGDSFLFTPCGFSSRTKINNQCNAVCLHGWMSLFNFKMSDLLKINVHDSQFKILHGGIFLYLRCCSPRFLSLKFSHQFVEKIEIII